MYWIFHLFSLLYNSNCLKEIHLVYYFIKIDQVTQEPLHHYLQILQNHQNHLLGLPHPGFHFDLPVFHFLILLPFDILFLCLPNLLTIVNLMFLLHFTFHQLLQIRQNRQNRLHRHHLKIFDQVLSPFHYLNY